jgi:hypothetical protein
LNDEQLRRQHAAVWAAIEEIAARREISMSRLAIQSGHDKTAFNPSKRSKAGGLRFPTMETIARVLALHQLTYEQFGTMVDEKMGRKG